MRLWKVAVATLALAGSLCLGGCKGSEGGASVDAAGRADDLGGIGEPADTGADGGALSDGTSADAGPSAQDSGATVADASQPDAGGGRSTDAAMTKDAGSLDVSAADTTTTTSSWYSTCGDPVCSGWKEKKDIPPCTDQQLGAACAAGASKCDPKDSCNALWVCADKDPKSGPGGCPISSRSVKTAIRYLDPAAELGLAELVADLPLATWRYRDGDARRRLGIILEDAPTAAIVDSRGDRVDLYGYASLALAAVKAQGRMLREQRAEIEALKAELAALKARQGAVAP